jgi:hypothetical protein
MRRRWVTAAVLLIATAAACTGPASSPTLSVDEAPAYLSTATAAAREVAEAEQEALATASTDAAAGDTLNRGGLGLGSGH